MVHLPPGSPVIFAGALPNDDTTGKVVRSEGDYLTVLTRKGALIRTLASYCRPYMAGCLTLGDLRRMTDSLPDDTMLFVDGTYKTSMLTAAYDTWETKDPNTGKVHTRHAISVTHTMSNVPQ